MNYSPIECPVCTYNRNALNAKNCKLCGTPLAEIANFTEITSLSPRLENVKKRSSVGSVKPRNRTKDSFGNMKAWLSQLSQSYGRNADVAVVSTARGLAMHLRRHLTKMTKFRQQVDVDKRSSAGQRNLGSKPFGTEQQKNFGANLYCNDPWSSDSPQLDSSSSKPSSESKVEPTDSIGVKQQIGNVSNHVVDRLASPKTFAVAKILLILAAMFGVSSMTTIFIYNRYGQEPLSVTQQKEPPSTYSDIKLYDTMEAVPNVPEGVFSYGGALCFAALQRDGMNAAISNAYPTFLLRYVEPISSNPGCTTGIKMLLDGELSIAQNSRPLTTAEVNVASSRGYKLESVPVAIDGIVFYTNKSLGIKSLSLEQMRDIYFGKITNWKQVGGKDLPITPIGLDPKIDSIMRLLMETENAPTISDNVVIARDFTSAIRKASSTPGAISYASSAILKGQSSITPIALSANSDSPAVSAILADGTVNLQAFEKNVYPLTRRLYVVIRRDGSPEEKAGVAYTNLLLSKEGQNIFKRAGFVPLFSDGSSKSQ
ncbi:MAG: substrate-binding domain-containing protein [Cyanobacteria bacterium P01_A01_bin.83]